MTKNKSPEIFICECYSTEHQIVFYQSSEEIEGKEIPSVYAHVHLNKRPFHIRLKYAIQYLLGRRCRFGAFDEFIFNPEDAERLQSVVDYLKQQ